MIKKQCLSLFCAICLFVLLFSLSGCGKNTKPAKTNDVDFTVVSAGDVPEELNKLIKERKKNQSQKEPGENPKRFSPGSFVSFLSCRHKTDFALSYSSSFLERLIRFWLSISVTLTFTISPIFISSSTFSTRCFAILEI